MPRIMKWRIPQSKNDALEPVTLFGVLVGGVMLFFMLTPLVLRVPERAATITAGTCVLLGTVISSLFSLHTLRPRLRGSFMDKALYVLLPLSLLGLGLGFTLSILR
jgi:hypothetical protein